MNIRFLSLPDQEVSDAVEWYEEQAEGLSRAFLDEAQPRKNIRKSLQPERQSLSAHQAAEPLGANS